MRHDAGLTLIEMLIVLAIIGIASGMTVLSLGSGRRSVGAEAEARRLGNTVQAAADAALAGNSGLALALDSKGYAVVRWDGRRLASAAAPLGTRHDFAAGLQLAGPPAVPVPIVAGGLGPPLALQLTGSSGSWRIAFDGLTVVVAPV